jgi:tetratricopeptide (TPR) repeat protein
VQTSYVQWAYTKEETMEQELVQELIAKADQLYIDGDLAAARAAYEEILAAAPGTAWAYSRLGAILAQMGDAQAAEQSLLQAIELDPKLPQAHSNLGNLYYSQGEFERALDKYKAAVALNPDSPVFHENLHAAYKKLGKLSEAVNELKQAHRLNRDSAKSEAKERFTAMRASVKRRTGCFGTSLITLLLTAIVLAAIFY